MATWTDKQQNACIDYWCTHLAVLAACWLLASRRAAFNSNCLFRSLISVITKEAVKHNTTITFANSRPSSPWNHWDAFMEHIAVYELLRSRELRQQGANYWIAYLVGRAGQRPVRDDDYHWRIWNLQVDLLPSCRICNHVNRMRNGMFFDSFSCRIQFAVPLQDVWKSKDPRTDPSVL